MCRKTHTTFYTLCTHLQTALTPTINPHCNKHVHTYQTSGSACPKCRFWYEFKLYEFDMWEWGVPCGGVRGVTLTIVGMEESQFEGLMGVAVMNERRGVWWGLVEGLGCGNGDEMGNVIEVGREEVKVEVEVEVKEKKKKKGRKKGKKNKSSSKNATGDSAANSKQPAPSKPESTISAPKRMLLREEVSDKHRVVRQPTPPIAHTFLFPSNEIWNQPLVNGERTNTKGLESENVESWPSGESGFVEFLGGRARGWGRMVVDALYG